MIIIHEIDAKEETKAANILCNQSIIFMKHNLKEYQHYKEHYPALIINPLHTPLHTETHYFYTYLCPENDDLSYCWIFVIIHIIFSSRVNSTIKTAGTSIGYTTRVRCLSNLIAECMPQATESQVCNGLTYTITTNLLANSMYLTIYHTTSTWTLGGAVNLQG